MIQNNNKEFCSKMSADRKVFQYVQFKSIVSPDFWYKLAEVKLDFERLDEGRREIFGVKIDDKLLAVL